MEPMLVSGIVKTSTNAYDKKFDNHNDMIRLDDVYLINSLVYF